MKNLFLLAIVLLCFSSCQTYRTIIPTIEGRERQGIRLNQPIIIALQDLRANVRNHDATVESLKQGLRRIYGDAITFKPYFEPTPDNSVAIKINIRELGSQFGIRTIQVRTVRNQTITASSAVATSWGSAVSTAIVSLPIYQDHFVPQGWWLGTVLLDVSLVDNLFDNKVTMFPIAGEDRQANTWGYRSATIASQNAWNKTSSHLLRFIDSIIMRIIEFQ